MSQKHDLNLNIELFDEKYQLIKKINKIINKECYLVKAENDIKTVEKQIDINYRKNEENLFQIRFNKNNTIKLDNQIIIKKKFQTKESLDFLDKKLWYIIDSENCGYSLCESDIIKIGDMKYIIHEISFIQDNENNLNDENKNIRPYYYKVPEIDNYKKCKFRIADNDAYNDDYNVCLCNCKNELIHFPCLKKYIKIEKSENGKNTIKRYFTNNAYCKKCYTAFPIKFQLKGKNIFFDTIHIEKPTDSNYIILESLGHKYEYENKNENGNEEKKIGYNKLVYVIKLDEDIIKIGKNEKNDIVINDPSVGDEHAKIFFDKKNKKILLKNLSKDNNTFVLIKKDLEVNEKINKIKVRNIIVEANLI